jgi:phage tail-like protein
MGRVIPYASYMFRVDISWGPGGRHVADFSECTGLGAQITSETIEEGGRNNSVRRLPSRIKFDNVKLKRGYVRNSELFAWCMGMSSPRTIQRHDIGISLVQVADRGASTALVFTWILRNAFPVKWTGPSMKANASGEQAIAMEELELAFERMDWVS